MVSDTCLARGTKQKLSQCTLLQLNFCSESKVDTQFCKSDQVGVNVTQMVCVDILSDTVHKLLGFIEENLTNDDCIDYRVDSPSLLPENKMPKYEMAETVDDICGALLKTFIVGRKFSDEVRLNCGASITLLRDPNNVKDCNAIKVPTLWPCHPLDFRFIDVKSMLGPFESGFCYRSWML
ncbi:hypothetical protein Acr_18g0001370 [Actinidia rufa]|uniref:Uncharacterized protein n=1 Tax=Actinidia rufa TaxID=165716 RepID=A0A7J0G5C0_9ERIC|nr:hypothetical protein Acr_18g0001370 [Actinidia rufa]